LFALGITAVMASSLASSAKAQTLNTGRIAGINTETSTCELIVFSDDAEFPTTLQASAEICAQALAGQQIQYTSEITQLTAIAPPSVGTVVGASAGDRVCYVDLESESGQITTHYANFDICSQQGIVGAQVRLTYEAANILDYNCMGNPDCGRSDRAELIVNADIISPAPTRAPISSLPDGNYRYWSGPAQSFVSEDELGGFLFLFRKQGNNITGVYGYFDQEALCVQGQVNENTITGISVQTLRGATVRSPGETFVDFYPFSSSIKVRRGRQINRETVRYSSTLLDVSELNRINAGDRLPPSRC